jgi:transglutaminase-like putative cysteine protease
MFKLDEGWATVLLLMVLVTIAAWGVEAPGWTPGLWVASVAGIIGVLAGLALSKSRFNGLVATLFAACYGVFVVGNALLLLLRGTYNERSYELVVRVNNFIYYAINGGTSRDNFPFPFFVGLIFWFIGVSAAWSLFRRGSVWPAIIPGGLVLLINAYYVVGDRMELYVGAYLILALILLTRMNLLAREQEWRSARVAFSSDARFEFLRAGLVAAVVVVGAAWFGQRATDFSSSPVAVAAWQRMNGGWTVVRENFERLFNAVRNPGIAANDFYGESLALSGATNLSDRLIFEVTVGPVRELGPDGREIEISEGLPTIPRYYWRATAYQQYVDGRWEVGDGSAFREHTPTQAAGRLPPFRLRRDIAANFTMYLESPSILYVLPQPKSLNRAAMFQTYLGPGGALDPVTVRAQDVLTGEDNKYQVIGSVSVADVASLNVAGTNYPEWVRAFFLEVPESVTPRTRELAQTIVREANARTPYQQAQAITDWLRQNITYDLGIQPPPSGVEPLDYFLFESQRGYCNYYASAAVIMLRSLGIPARMAVGFNQGFFDNAVGTYVVRERNAHAWPEVYFPDYGWIEFEPTASEAPLVRPERRITTSGTPQPEDANPDAVPTPDLEARNDDDEPVDNVTAGFDWAGLFSNVGRVAGVIALIVLGIVLFGVITLMRLNLIGWESLGQPGETVLKLLGRAIPSGVTRAYRELERGARWLGLKLPETQTPRERATHLNKNYPAAQPAVTTITAQYMAEQYGRDQNLPNGNLALNAWRNLRLPLWREGIARVFRRWLGEEK